MCERNRKRKTRKKKKIEKKAGRDEGRKYIYIYIYRERERDRKGVRGEKNLAREFVSDASVLRGERSRPYKRDYGFSWGKEVGSSVCRKEFSSRYRF